MNFRTKLWDSLGIESKVLDKNSVVLTMPVDERTHQPAGYLHGGTSVLLAETAASIGSALNVDLNTTSIFGMEINANHIKSKKEGIVTATATPVHIGKRTMVWEIKITDEKEALISLSRCTVGVVEKRK
ncbi:hotdog fold thioesterase [Ornithinibacillus sp. 4-3]|uniref:Hotdog fold thioesterase n=1 Tax=Ornithinibacillus sp. 4-3 TaxID=3231488 RepID=A0AB39HM25_9BACI